MQIRLNISKEMALLPPEIVFHFSELFFMQVISDLLNSFFRPHHPNLLISFLMLFAVSFLIL